MKWGGREGGGGGRKHYRREKIRVKKSKSGFESRISCLVDQCPNHSTMFFLVLLAFSCDFFSTIRGATSEIFFAIYLHRVLFQKCGRRYRTEKYMELMGNALQYDHLQLPLRIIIILQG